MLKRKYRLANLRNFNKARFLESQFFTLRFSQNQNKEPKFAFVISKKIDKKAVARNKIKRYLSGSIASIIDKISPGDYILIAKKEIVNKNQEEVKSEVEKIFKEKHIT